MGQIANAKLNISSTTIDAAKKSARQHIESSEIKSLHVLKMQINEASSLMNNSMITCASLRKRTNEVCSKHEKELNSWKAHLNKLEDKYQDLTKYFNPSLLEIDSKGKKFVDTIECKNVEKTYKECIMTASHKFNEVQRNAMLDHTKHQAQVVKEANMETSKVLDRYLKVQNAASEDKKLACNLIDEMAENKTNYWSAFIKRQSRHAKYLAKLSAVKMNVSAALKRNEKEIKSIEQEVPSTEVKAHEETCTGDLVFSNCHKSCDRTCHDTKERCTNQCWSGCGCPSDKPFRGDGSQSDRCFNLFQCEEIALESEMHSLESKKVSSPTNRFEKEVFEATKKSLKEASMSTAKTMNLLRQQ